MKVINTKFDKSHWRTRVYYRDKGKAVIIQRISDKYPDSNHEVYLEGESLEAVKRIILETIKIL